MEIADKCPVHRTLTSEIDSAPGKSHDRDRRGGAGGRATCVESASGRLQGADPHDRDEPYAPYQRPPLSKKFLTERPPADTLYFRPEKFWAEQGVTADYGAPVEAIDRASKRVTSRADRPKYSTLFLSTGTRARPLPVPGADLSGVFSLRKIDDVRALRAPMDAASGSLSSAAAIGLEVAAVARARARGHGAGSRGPRDEARHLAGHLGLHAGFSQEPWRGHPAWRAARVIEGEGRIAQVRLADGRDAPADLVLLAVGAKPNDDLPLRRAWLARTVWWSTSTARRPIRRSMRRATARVSEPPLRPQAAARMRTERTECVLIEAEGRGLLDSAAATYDPAACGL